MNISGSNTVTYSVQITAPPEVCRAPDQVVNARIQFVGFGQVDLTIALQCDCGCEADMVRPTHDCHIMSYDCHVISHVTWNFINNRNPAPHAMDKESWNAPPASAQMTCKKLHCMYCPLRKTSLSFPSTGPQCTCPRSTGAVQGCR